MINYIIWNGVDSREIKGLVICELPPISKPLMRVAETVVDGVDGSIIEELGYESYDKALTIGLTQKADTDEVIKYFSGNGEVVFSNEADKYYKASIISQIDYARLVRFKVATVTFRVQPFKYEYAEKQSVLTSGKLEGVSIQLTDRKIIGFAIDGEGTQSGGVDLKIIGKNFLNLTSIFGKTITENGGTLSCGEDGGVSGNGTPTDYMHIYNKSYVLPVGTYTLSLSGDGKNIGCSFAIRDESQAVLATDSVQNDKKNATINLANYPNYYDILFDIKRGSNNIEMSGTAYFQLEKDTTPTEYETYRESTVTIPSTGEIEELLSLELGDGVNNITNSENVNMVISYVDNNMIVNNVGNHIAKPVMEIKGSGTVTIAVDGNTLFRYTFPEGEDTVIIDSQRQDAYDGAILKNRNMSGEFPTFAVGKNVITWDGNITSMKITAKSRWL